LFRIGLGAPCVLLLVIFLAAAANWYIRTSNKGSAGY
jgi:hypothetical protein